MNLKIPLTTVNTAHLETPEPRVLQPKLGGTEPQSQPRINTYATVVEAEFDKVRHELVEQAKSKIESGFYLSPEFAERVADAIL